MYLNQDLSLFCSEDLFSFFFLQEIPFRGEKIIAKTVSKITFHDVRAPWAVKQIEPRVLIGLTTFEQIIPSDFFSTFVVVASVVRNKTRKIFGAPNGSLDFCGLFSFNDK